MTKLTTDQLRDMQDTMRQLAQIQTTMFLDMTGQGVPAEDATELIKNLFNVMMTLNTRPPETPA